MTAPELIRQTNTDEIQAEMPDVTVRLFADEDYDEFAHLVKKDQSYLRARSYGLDPMGIVTWAEDIKDGSPLSGVRIMMVRKGNAIAGCIVLGSEDENTENISCFVGKDYMQTGIISSAVKAVIENENRNGKDITANVKSDNIRSLKLLARTGFKHSRWNREYSEDIYIKKASDTPTSPPDHI